MTYEEAVKWFGEHMLKVLTENGCKEPISQHLLFKNLTEEITELHTELCKKNPPSKAVIKEATDVVNYAMMLALSSIGVSLEPIRETTLLDTWPAYRYG